MTAVRLSELNSNRILEIVYELREQGLVQGVDFNFKYIPGGYVDGMGWVPRSVIFEFADESYSTWFTIGWA